jgi:hypothetical protein
MADEDPWKQRFYVYAGARMLGLATLAAGLAIGFTDLVRPGGWPLVGGVIMALGAIDAFVAPRLLRKKWKKDDGEA